jgi:ATP-binding cassette subfamily C protein
VLNQQSRAFIARFARAYPIRTAVMVLLLVFAGLAEGIGIAALLPVLTAGIERPGTAPTAVEADQDALSEIIQRGMDTLHIPRTVPSLLAIVVVAILLKACFRWLAMQQVGYSVAKVARDLRERLIRALMNVRWSYFTGQATGYFANAISTEAQRAAASYRRACAALAGVFQIPVYAGLIVAISWKIALASMVLGAFAAAVLGSFVAMSRKAGGDQTDRMKSLLAQLTDALQSIKPIKAMGRDDKFEDLVRDDIIALEDVEQRQVVASESLRSFQEPVLMAIIALGLFGALQWGAASFADILVIAFLFHRLAGRFHFVQLEYEVLAVGESAFWSLEALTAEAEAMAEPPSGTRPAPDLVEGIDLEGVSFSYGDRPILEEASFTIPAGAFVALVGPSGAGKTTILDLIAGLHEPESGRVCIDGIPLREIDRGGWRRRIGYVPQDTVLFHDSVRRNVWISSEPVDDERVRTALEQADAWSFVESLPEGLDTVIGERGSKLSGGQRQRLAIARALLGEPRLLMLDEATTALDPRTEAAILETLSKLRGEVTVLAISHQNALRGVADVLYELSNGEVRRIAGPEAPRESAGAAGW